MVNGHDIAHGGYVFLLADTAFAVACNSYGQSTVAAGCDIAFLAAGAGRRRLHGARPPSGTVRARSGIYDVAVRRDDGSVVAELRGRSRTVAGTLVAAGRSTDMSEAFLVDGVRTPIGRYGGALAAVRPDDLAAHALRALVARLPQVDWSAVDDVVLGCANQAGEDNRNVARMALLLAGLPETVSGSTVNRLCGSGADAVAIAARAVRAGEADLVVAGGVESMSRAPFVMAKAQSAYDRTVAVHDTTLGWRFVNPAMERLYGTDSMGETAENVAEEHGISRRRPGRRSRCARRSGRRRRQKDGRLAQEIVPVEVPQRRGDPIRASTPTSTRARRPLEALGRAEAGLPRGRLGHGGQLVRGQRRGGRAARRVGDSGRAVRPRAAVPGHRRGDRRRGAAGDGHRAGARDDAGCSTGPASGSATSTSSSSTRRSPRRRSPCCAGLGLPDDAEHVNPNGGAIALGHPLGMSGARLALTAAVELADRDARRAVATMCIGVGQGIALLLER